MQESTLNDLYHSAVRAFPRTTRRQYAIDPIRIVEMRWTPFIGLKTLFVKGRAQNEGKQYSPIILFKNVNYGDEMPMMLRSSDGIVYNLDYIRYADNDAVVRCDCNDFYWRFNYYNSIDKSLYGRQRAKYESQGINPPANPEELPGMCKHLMKLIWVVRDSGVLI